MSTATAQNSSSCEECFKNQTEIESLKIKLVSSSKAAFNSMRAASQIGNIFTFMEQSGKIKNFEDLAAMSVATAKSFSVRCTIQIRSSENIITLADKGEVTSIQLKLLAVAKDKGRILEKKDMLIFNDEHVSLLCYKLPSDDLEEFGRLRDVLIQLVSAAESRFRSLILETMLRGQAQQASEIIGVIRKISSDNHIHASNIIKNLAIDLQAAVSSLNLTEEQEIHFTQLGDNGIEQLDSLLSNSHLVEEHISEVLNGLRQAVDMAAKN
ncbi:MAG: hypothetical protein V4629_07875 [Pseudomonadota bacterium]